MTFSTRLKQLRLDHGLTQPQLAITINITDRTLRNYESGKMEPTLSVITAIANFFQVSADYLLCFTDDPSRHEGNN